jgi:HEAT repeat protein
MKVKAKPSCDQSSQDTNNISAMVAAFASDEAAQRERARRKVVAVGPLAVAPLTQALAHSKTQVRWEAAKALTEIADPSSASALIAALEDEDGGIRWLAAEGLIALKEDALKPLMHALIRRSDSTWVCEGAHHVLHELSEGPCSEVILPVLAALGDPVPEIESAVAAADALEKLEESAR